MNSSKTPDSETWFSGLKLYGDDFTPEQIARWFQEESEGYADLGNKQISDYAYQYHELNYLHGFRHLKKVPGFDQVLGLGAAWGHEFLPLMDKIGHLTIAEPSEQLRSEQLGSLKPVYVKPEIDGTLDFKENTFDLVSCFGTLHHIPNVTFVLGELLRVLKPGGYLLLREPIISLGDWNQPRPGLTKNERGIPVSYFDRIFREKKVKIISRTYCLTMTYQLQKIFKRVLKKPLTTYRWYIQSDLLLSALLGWNVRYHARKKMQRMAPSNIFYVIRKT